MPAALITGASTGIGQATALRLARGGWTVLAGVRDPAAGEMLQQELSEGSAGGDGGGRLIPLTLDVTDAEQISAAARRIEGEAAEGSAPAQGGLDALVNNAGIAVSGPLELVPLPELRRQLEVNVVGQVAIMQAVLPALRRSRGRIVFVSSVGGRVATPFLAPYQASKHALEAFGDALRLELRSSHVRVALIEPGSVATPMWDKGREDVDRVTIPPELQGQYGHVPGAMGKVIEDTARRGVPPEQVAQTIEQALTARRMKARYVVGRDARAIVLLHGLLPDLVFDRVVRRALGV
jgi:NAD(P)-dependent dehydrogenase (short-subunit alcohol dehydrogenase family)